LLGPEHLKKNAIIYDIAQPINVSPEVCEKRKDILRVDGCYIKLPEIDLGINMGPPKGVTFSCLAETTLQALENDNDHHVGEISIEHVYKTMFWAQKHNFKHAPLTNFSIPIPEERLRSFQFDT